MKTKDKHSVRDVLNTLSQQYGMTVASKTQQGNRNKRSRDPGAIRGCVIMGILALSTLFVVFILPAFHTPFTAITCVQGFGLTLGFLTLLAGLVEQCGSFFSKKRKAG